MKGSSKALVKEIARQRISILFDLARRNLRDRPELSREYVVLLRSISAHYRIGLGRDMRNVLCSKCNSVLVPGLTASVVLASSKGYAAYKCMVCGTEKHIVYKRQKGKNLKLRASG
ncbi:hypothetical protein M1329_01615 [Candidatus Marsarchaeota archaeon]|nr:hypothetical protein [Candidatus Marsarchaeota archaeon]MCL5100020.1 hypothetical protein [Candidatus Marsarchaeota archaeon]